MEKERILTLLSKDYDKRITLSEIQDLTGFCHRKIKKIISDLREDIPIVTQQVNGGGYWIATTPTEINFFVKMLNKRIQSNKHTISTIKKFIRKDSQNDKLYIQQDLL